MRWTQVELDRYLADFHKPVDEPCFQEADPGPESILQGKIEAWCKEWGRPFLSFHQSKKAKRMLPAGWPDMEIIMPGGKTLRLELKSARGRPSDEQKRLRLQFMALGHEVHTLNSYRAFMTLVGGKTAGRAGGELRGL